MWFIWIAQDIHRICYVYNYGPPRGKAGQRMCLESWALASLLPEDALLSRIALMSILGFPLWYYFQYSLLSLSLPPSFSLPPFFFFFAFRFKVSESVARPRQNPDRTASRNRASDYYYPGSEDFVLKIQFPCYRQIFRSPLRFPALPAALHLACGSLPHILSLTIL